MPRDHRVTAHVTEATRKELERNADEEEMSLSAYINKLLERGLRQEAENEVSANSRAVENLQTQIDEGTRQLRDAAKEAKDANRKTGVYGIAAFELLKREYADGVVDDALDTGFDRLRDDDREPEQSQDNETDDNQDLDIEELRGDKDQKTDGGEADDEYDPFDPLADGGERE
jgi:hypothetical protein